MRNIELYIIIREAAKDEVTALDLSGNQLSSIPREIGQLTNLTRLDLDRNRLTSLPAQIGQLKKLITLDLDRNRLKSLPRKIGLLNNLITLRSRTNQLRSLPPEIGQLKKLTKLYLDENQLTSLPPEIGQLTNLTELHLNGNQLTSLPPEIGKLTNLIELHLDENQLTSLPPEIGQLTNLTELHLEGNQLTSLLPEIGVLTELTELYASANQLTTLPPAIGQLTNLTTFGIYGNRLVSLPPEIGQLKKLAKLFLDENQLTSLPPEIGRLTSLIELWLYENRLTSLPPEIGKLKNLTTLRLYKNELTSLPREIGQQKELAYLYVNGNKLTSLPPEIGQGGGLIELDVRDNQLTSLPPEIGQLTNLIELGLDGNPNLTQPPPEIVKEGTEAILQYFRGLKEEGEEKQYRAKLIFVGEGDVGKTCALHQLKGHGFVEDQETTHGIDIERLEIDHPTEADKKMSLGTWDFGGQRIYRATQQLFFTRRSVYVLCWNARKDPVQCELDFWLRTINSLAPDSPVILLATHIDERAPDVNYHKLKCKFPQLIANCAVSNKSGEAIDDLRRVIQEATASLPQMGESWPRNWLKAKEKIGSLKKHHISRQDYIDICKGSGVDDKAVWTLASWLHDLGNILYFHGDKGLEDMVILKPEWITKAISKVLEDEHSRNLKHGVLDHNRLPGIWKEYDKNLHPAFLRLMEKFDLSYRIHGADSSVVAELLPYEPPKFDWLEVSELPQSESRLTMNFDMNFVPAGVMTWFIVRTHRFTIDKHWREGVYLVHGDHRTRAELDIERRLFTLEVQGVMPHYFFSILKDSVDEILKRFPGLNVERHIPCICHELFNLDKPCLHNFKYSDLVDRVRHNVGDAQCEKSYKQVPVSKLLYGIHSSTIDEVIEEIRKHDRKSDLRYVQMASLIIRNFLRVYNLEMNKLEADCPSLLTISPRDRGPFKEERLFTTVYDVQLWCQMPGCCHPLLDGDYELKQPKRWLVKLKPWLSVLLESLKYVELATAVTGGFISKAVQEAVKDKIGVMGKVVELIPDSEERINERHISEHYLTPAKVSGADLRVLSKLLDNLDDSHFWGGLSKTTSPEGDILWLCPEHYKVFDPGLPDLG